MGKVEAKEAFFAGLTLWNFSNPCIDGIRHLCPHIAGNETSGIACLGCAQAHSKQLAAVRDPPLSEPFHTENDHFTKTGSGQNTGKLGKIEAVFAGGAVQR